MKTCYDTLYYENRPFAMWGRRAHPLGGLQVDDNDTTNKTNETTTKNRNDNNNNNDDDNEQGPPAGCSPGRPSQGAGSCPGGQI